MAKSNPTEPIQKSFRAIQRLTNTKHRQINESIIGVIGQLGITLSNLEYEFHPFGDDKTRELRCDAWFKRNERPEAVEFTHRADGDASVATIASYVLGKIQDYARDYALI